MRAFLQTDTGGWSDDIPEREEDEAPELERNETDGVTPRVGTCAGEPTKRNRDRT